MKQFLGLRLGPTTGVLAVDRCEETNALGRSDAVIEKREE